MHSTSTCGALIHFTCLACTVAHEKFLYAYNIGSAYRRHARRTRFFADRASHWFQQQQHIDEDYRNRIRAICPSSPDWRAFSATLPPCHHVFKMRLLFATLSCSFCVCSKSCVKRHAAYHMCYHLFHAIFASVSLSLAKTASPLLT